MPAGAGRGVGAVKIIREEERSKANVREVTNQEVVPRLTNRSADWRLV